MLGKLSKKIGNVMDLLGKALTKSLPINASSAKSVVYEATTEEFIVAKSEVNLTNNF